MDSYTEKSSVTPEIASLFGRLFSTTKRCLAIGAQKLQLQACKIAGDIFYWKVDGDGYLAIDPITRVIYCTDLQFKPVSFGYDEFLEEVADIHSTLEFFVRRYENNPGTSEGPIRQHCQFDERYDLIGKFVKQCAREIVDLGDKAGLKKGKIVGDKLFIYRFEDEYLVICPHSDDWLCASPDFDPAHLHRIGTCFSALRFLGKSLQNHLESLGLE